MRARRARHADVDDYDQQQKERDKFAEAAFVVYPRLTSIAQVLLKTRRKKEISIWDGV